MASFQERPHPGRRRSRPSQLLHPLQSSRSWTLLFVVLLITSLVSLTHAAVVDPAIARRSLADELAERGEDLVDRWAAPPTIPRSDLATRQDKDGNGSPLESNSSASSSAAASATAPSAATSSAASSSRAAVPSSSASGTPTTIVSAPSSLVNSPLPSPFDTSLGSNFTSNSCPSFFDSFLTNATFKACLPLSLLLQNSNSFFKVSKSLVLLSQTLDATCRVSLSDCSAVMSSLADELTTDDKCGLDFRNQNPIVLQAHAGLVAYEPVYQAGCLKNVGTGNYCFADAITNTSNAADSYPYYLALGIPLPAASRPTCNQCLQNTMGVFASAAVDKAQPLSGTFVAAAQQIDVGCGPTFVNSTVPVATVGNTGSRALGPSPVICVVTALTVLALSNMLLI